MRLRCNLFVSLLVLLFSVFLSQIDADDAQTESNAQIPAALLASALNHVAEQMPDGEALVEKLQSNNVDSLYDVAKSMNANAAEGSDDKLNSIQIWHALADGPARHILSMVKLGFTYSEADKSKAIEYFVQAGEGGPHQIALYNAGRLSVEEGDYGAALKYIRAAATLGNDESKAMYADPKRTETAKSAYEKLSSKLIENQKLSLKQMLDIFPYASIDNEPTKGGEEEKQWLDAKKDVQTYWDGLYGRYESLEPSKLDSLKDSVNVKIDKLRAYVKFSKLQQQLLGSIMSKTNLAAYESLANKGNVDWREMEDEL